MLFVVWQATISDVKSAFEHTSRGIIAGLCRFNWSESYRPLSPIIKSGLRHNRRLYRSTPMSQRRGARRKFVRACVHGGWIVAPPELESLYRPCHAIDLKRGVYWPYWISANQAGGRREREEGT